MATSHPPFYDPEITVIGEPVLTQGLTNVGAIYEVGLLVFGLFWQCDVIWSTVASTASTSWSATSSTNSTTWTATSSTSSTTWTEVIRSEC